MNYFAEIKKKQIASLLEEIRAKPSDRRQVEADAQITWGMSANKAKEYLDVLVMAGKIIEKEGKLYAVA